MTKKILLAILLPLHATIGQAATVAWDGGGDGSTWSDPLNWTTDTVPSTSDDVIINDPGTVTIRVTDSVTIQSLDCQENLILTSGTFTLIAGNSSITGTLQLNPETSLQVDGPTAALLASGSASINNGNLYALNGGSLTLSLLTSYESTSNADHFLRADGAGSLLSFPSLTTLSGSDGTFDDLFVEALNGATNNLPALITVSDGACIFSAQGTGSTITLTSLNSFDGKFNHTSSGFHAIDRGTIDIPSLTSVRDGDFILDATSTMQTDGITEFLGGGSIHVDQPESFVHLTTIHHCNIIIDNELPAFPVLNDIDDSSIHLTNGVSLSLPLVTTYTSTSNADRTLEAGGTGSLLSFPNLTTLTGATDPFDDLFIQAVDGGKVQFALLSTVSNGACAVKADGIGSEIGMPSLTSFDGHFHLTESGFRALNGGNIDVPVLTSVRDGDFIVDDTSTIDSAQITEFLDGGTIDVDQALPFTALTTLNHVNLHVNGPVPTFPVLSDIDHSRIVVSNSAIFSLPLITSFSHRGNRDVWLEANTGAILSFPNVTDLSGATGTFDDLFIHAFSGGRVEFPILTTISDGQTSFHADGTNSVVQLTSLTSFDGRFNITDSGFRATNGGTIDAPLLTSMRDANLQIDAISSMQTSQITELLGGGTITFDVPLDFSSLTTANDVTLAIHAPGTTLPSLSNIDHSTIVVSGGTDFSLPLITSYIHTGNHDATLEANSSSTLSFPNLVTLTGATGTFDDLFVHAFSGGTVDLPALTTVPDSQVTFKVDGEGSVLNLTSLTSFDGRFNATDSGFRATDGGTLNFPPTGTIDIQDANIAIDTGGTIHGDTVLFQTSVNLTGDGTLFFDLQSHGHIQPGPTYGTLTIDGDYTQFSDGQLSLDLGGFTPGTDQDQLIVTGSALLDGTLTANPSILTPFPDDIATLLTWGNAAGSFATLNLPTTGVELTWEPLFFPGSFQLLATVTKGPWFIGNGDGYAAEYFHDTNLTDSAITRVDSVIDFSPFNPTPDPTIADDGFSAQWETTFLAPLSQNYTFYSKTDDGVRLWVDLDQSGTFEDASELLIDEWGNVTIAIEFSSDPFALTGGQPYKIKMEYFDRGGQAFAQLFWEGDSISKSLTTVSQFYSAPPALTEMPVPSPIPDTYQQSVTVTLTSATVGVEFRYTLDGSEPTLSSPLYIGPLTFTDTTTIKAKSFASGVDASPTMHARYVIEQELPDLIVTSITAPSNIIPGQSVSLSWDVQNIGLGPYSGTRVDGFALSANSVPGGDEFNTAFFSVTDSIAAGATQSYSRIYTAPFESPNGDLFFIATADANNSHPESDENNNDSPAPTASNIPALLKLFAPISSISENASNPEITLSLSRNGDISNPLTVSLLADIPDELSFPPTVQIPVGAYSISVTATVINDGTTDGDQDVTITATVSDYMSSTISITTIDASPPSLTVEVNTPSVTEGNSTTLLITRNPVTDFNLAVSLSSSDFGELSFTNTAVIPSNQASVVVSLDAVHDTDLEGDNTSIISASAPGHIGDTANLLIVDDDIPALTLSISPGNISEDGGVATIGITRSPIANFSMTVELTQSDPSAATMPTILTFDPFEATVFATASAVDDVNHDGPQTTTIQAILRHPTDGGILTQSSIGQLHVTDDEGPTLSMTFAKDHVLEGSTTTGTIRRTPNDGSSITVDLISSDPTQVTVPTTVSMAPDVATADFDVTGVEDGVTDGTVDIDITASATGFNSGISSIAVTDELLPDLILSGVSLPATADTDAFVSYAYTLTNTGSGDLTSPILIRSYLSSDANFGGDTLLSQYLYEPGLPSGTSISRTETFRTPTRIGNFYLIVQADADATVTEVIESNNVGVSPDPINVTSAYSATVATDTMTAPADTPIVMTGSATQNGSAAPSALVTIHICVRETCRTIAALTDSSGNFSTVWTPLPGEAGTYTIGASHPAAESAPIQDTFTLYGLNANPGDWAIDLLENAPTITVTNTLTNLGDVDLTSLTATLTGVPPHISATATLADGSPNPTLPGLGSIDLLLDLSASSVLPASFGINLDTAEGASLSIPVGLSVTPATSELIAEPGSLVAGMVPGQQTFVTFDVTNQGAISTDQLTIALPEAPWLSSATVSPLPPLAPGESTSISLQLCPATNLPLTIYDGSLNIIGAEQVLAVPFSFRALSTAKGDLTITAEDELTYYAEGNPNLAGAEITLIDALDNSIAATGTTDTNGTVTFTNLMEGYYTIQGSAPNHGTAKKTVFITPGITNISRIFLQKQTVRYTWTVLPTTVEQRTRIVVTTVFETRVPIPVVTIEPALVDLSTFTESETSVNFTITNHGLLAAKDSRLDFNGTSEWEIVPLISDLGDLPAQSSITVPVVFRRLSNALAVGNLVSAAATSCASTPNGVIRYDINCGGFTSRHGSEIHLTGGSSAGSVNCGGSRILPPGGVGTGVIVTPRDVTITVLCDACRLTALADCVIGYTPCVASCPWAVIRAYQSGTYRAGLIAAIGCLASCSPYALVAAGVNTLICYDAFAQCSAGGGGGPGGGGGGGDTDADPLQAKTTVPGRGVVDSITSNIFDELEIYRDHNQTVVDVFNLFFGDPAWLAQVPDENFFSFVDNLNNFVQLTSDEGDKISTAEMHTLQTLPLPGGVSVSQVSAFISRWNRTLDYLDAGITTVSKVPPGQSTNFIDSVAMATRLNAMGAAYDASVADGFNDPVEGFLAKLDAAIEFLTTDRFVAAGKAVVAGGFNDPAEVVFEEQDVLGAPASDDGVCATVTLQIEQQAIVSRDAFEASLTIDNADTAEMTSVFVDLRVTDPFGVDITPFFDLGVPATDGINAETISGSSTGSFTWTIIPSDAVALTGPTNCFVSGTIFYTQSSNTVALPLSPESIQVFPNASLKLKYFQQRDVFSDDPFTTEIEPSIPFSLAVMVQNLGAGMAEDLRIISSQPEIIENEKGLFIDFKILATEVEGQPLTPSLTADIGDLESSEVKLARWIMTSTLHGHFIDFSATFEHENALGDPTFSIIDEVTIHEMIHEVNDCAPGADTLPDYLANDLPDPADLPDTVHLSDGSTAPVTAQLAATTTAPTIGMLSVPLTLSSPPNGYIYVRVPEPSDANLQLVSVMRDDGKALTFDVNAWITDRTFRDHGLPPIRENMLHLFDYDSTGSYTLTYALLPPPDNVPAESSVTDLPASSLDEFTVSWSGTDNDSIARYDIFVSIDGDPFELWLENTTETSALYKGNTGTTYGFFSVATDATGNREPAPATADATTTTSLTNTPVLLDPIPDQTVTENDTFIVLPSANDLDSSGPIRFALMSGPQGTIIDPSTGRVTWQTGENDGGRVETIAIEATDAGFPYPTATRSFTVTVIDTNSAPVLKPQSLILPENIHPCVAGPGYGMLTSQLMC